MKTVLQWIKTLPKRYRTRALANMEAKGSKGLSETDNLSDALYRAFVWDGTPEGHDFWAHLEQWAAGECKKGPKLP